MIAYVGWTVLSVVILGGVLYLGDRVQQLVASTAPLKGATRNG
ncbi:hypothetical protein [Pseudomonas sp. 2]|nr:hypothetical protein [Pseudomonas sp. 2]